MLRSIVTYNTYNKKERYVSIIVPTMIVLFAQTHFYPVLILAILLSLIYINKPFVLFPTVFITSLNTNYFAIVEGLSCGLVYSVLFIISLASQRFSPSGERSGKILLWIILLILFNFLESIISITGSMSTFVIMSENLITLYLLSNQKNINLREVSLTLSITACISIIILSMSFFTGNMVESDNGRYTVEGINENRMAMTYGQLSVVILFSFFYFKNRLFRLVSLSSFLFALLLLLMSGSRSALLGAIMGGFTIFTCNTILSGKSNRLMPIIFLSIILYVGINWLIDLDLPVFERFKIENIIEGRGTSRLDRRDFLLKNVFPSHRLMGIGLGGENEYAVSTGPCHNIFFDPLIQIGIIGVSLYWLFILSLIWKLPKLTRHHFEIILPLSLLVAALVNGMGEVMFFEKFFWNAIAMCVLFSNNLPHCAIVKRV